MCRCRSSGTIHDRVNEGGNPKKADYAREKKSARWEKPRGCKCALKPCRAEMSRNVCNEASRARPSPGYWRLNDFLGVFLPATSS